MNTPSPAFALEGASVRLGAVRALDGVDLRVERGERIAVIGPSGAGKSTLIGLLNGTVAPTGGTVMVLGVDLAGASARELRAVRRRVGTVHQRFALIDQLRVIHNVNAGRLGDWPLWRAALSLAAPREAERARSALERVGMAARLHERTRALSGGEQQRVAVARVLVQEPEAVLADEPVASVDPARGREVMALLHAVCAEREATLLASLHDVGLALEGFERVIGLRAGRVAFDRPPAQVRDEDVDALYAIEGGPP